MLLVLISAALHATWNAMVKGGSDRYFDTAGILIGASAVALILLPFLIRPAEESWPYLASSAIVHVAYFALIAASYKGDMSVVYPIMRGTAPALAAIGAALALHELPTHTGWAGVILVSIGVVMFAFEKRGTNSNLLVPVALALTNAVLIAVYTLIDGVGVRLSGQPLSYTCIGFVLCTLGFIPIVAGLRRKEALAHLHSEWRRGLVGGTCSIAAYSLALWAMTRAPIASVAALRETAILFGVLTAGVKFKERITPVRAMACLFVVAGVITIKLS
jgi:drug/metabolite transporter (DMT)-like permease